MNKNDFHVIHFKEHEIFLKLCSIPNHGLNWSVLESSITLEFIRKVINTLKHIKHHGYQ